MRDTPFALGLLLSEYWLDEFGGFGGIWVVVVTFLCFRVLWGWYNTLLGCISGFSMVALVWLNLC